MSVDDPQHWQRFGRVRPTLSLAVECGKNRQANKTTPIPCTFYDMPTISFFIVHIKT